MAPRILVRANDRVSFVGKTGSGKTYLAKHVCSPLSRLIVFDSKGTLGGGSGWNLTDDRGILRELKRGGPGRLRIQTPTDRDWRPWINLLWELTPITLYIDELMAVVPRYHTLVELDDLYTRGRELGIGVFGSMQRPVWVPPFVLSESTWIFLFRVTREDRKVVAAWGDDDNTLMTPIPDDHGFYTYKQGWRKPIYTPRFVARSDRVEVVPSVARKVAS